MRTLDLIQAMRANGIDAETILATIEQAEAIAIERECAPAQDKSTRAERNRRYYEKKKAERLNASENRLNSDASKTTDPSEDKKVPYPKKTHTSPIPPKEKPPTGSKRKSSLPAGFPDRPAKDAAVAYWQGKGRGYLSQRLETIADTFRAHHESRGTKAMSWPATWKTWYVNQVSFEEKSGKPAEVPRSSADPPPEHIDERSIEGQRKLVDRYKRTGKWDARTFAAPDDPNTRLRPEVLAEFGYSQQLI